MEKVGHQWLKVNETIGSRSKDHNSHWQIGCTLLKCQIAVDSDENVESARGPYEKLAIANPGPAELRNRGYFVAANFSGESTIYAFVEQQPHKADSIRRSLAISRNAMTWSRETLGKPSRKSSMDSPAFR